MKNYKLFVNCRYLTLKKIIMVSKIKYAGIFIGTLGYIMKSTHLEIGPITGNILFLIGLILIAFYALAKLFGK